MSALAPKVAFFGSPAFALPVLEAIRATVPVVLVVTQPDKPAGRRLSLTPPPVAARARELNLPLAQPQRLRRDEAFAATLAASGASVAVTCAYGKILPASLLAIPEYGFLNVHTSLLPELRGAAPIQWAIIRGYRRSGVTIMRTDPGLDTGPILLQEGLDIGPDENAADLADRLAALGAELIVRALRDLPGLKATPQDDAAATLAPLLTREDGRLCFRDPPDAVKARFLGVTPWPGTWFEHEGRRVKVHSLLAEAGGPGGAPGEVLAVSDGVKIAVSGGSIDLRVVQPESKARMNAGDWARGHGVKTGVILS